MKKHLYSLTASVCLLLGILSCSKETSKEMSTLHLRLTDAPAIYNKVNVDIQEVQINMTGDSTGWRTLTTNAGIYDLLSLQNGVDTLLATADVPTGNLVQVRFILGENNTVEAAGTVYPLTIPSGSESGLKILVNKQIRRAFETLVIDFDAGASVSMNADGSYLLKPVLKVK